MGASVPTGARNGSRLFLRMDFIPMTARPMSELRGPPYQTLTLSKKRGQNEVATACSGSRRSQIPTPTAVVALYAWTEEQPSRRNGLRRSIPLP